VFVCFTQKEKEHLSSVDEHDDGIFFEEEAQKKKVRWDDRHLSSVFFLVFCLLWKKKEGEFF
tara:strand:+ start:267 stop:452 length:186 start_codon:yes stop_codon:yes gene_type:complete